MLAQPLCSACCAAPPWLQDDMQIVFGRMDRIQPKERLDIDSFLLWPYAARLHKARFEKPFIRNNQLHLNT
jgi:hypothetical protein